MFYSNTSNPASPTDVNLREFSVSGTVVLIWPFAGIDSVNTIARIMEISSVSSTPILQMPPANQGSLGFTTIIINLGNATLTLQDNSSGALDTVTAGQVKMVSLRTNATVAGTWLSNTFGATTCSANSSLLAGLGLKSIAATLNVDTPSTNFSSSQSFGVGVRGQLYVWTGGAGAASFSASATLTNGWWMAFRNAGTGALTLTPSGVETIDGAATEALNPGDSCLVFCNGSVLYTVGVGRTSTITDSRLVKSVAGSADVTLTSTEYANNIMNFTGALTGNVNVIFPTAVKNYYVSNNTTGSFSLTMKTAAGTGVIIAQGGSNIVSCDGTNVIAATSSSAGTVTSITAGTGLNGGVITGSGTISLTNTAVGAGGYGDSTHFPNFTADAQGRLTAASQVALGTAAALNVGTSASNVVQLDGSAKLPAVDGSQLTNLSSSNKIINYQIVDVTDIVLSAAPTQSNVGSTISPTIPTKGCIELVFSGRLVVGTSASDLILGIRIGSTNYWPSYSSGNYLSSSDAQVGNQNNNLGYGIQQSSSHTLTDVNTMVGLFIEENSIPTGVQTVQIIAGMVTSGGTMTIKGTVITTRIYVRIFDHS